MYFLISSNTKVKVFPKRPEPAILNRHIGEIQVDIIHDDTLYFSTFIIDEMYQGQGYGRILLEYAIVESLKKYPNYKFKIDCCPLSYMGNDYVKFLKGITRFYFQVFKKYASLLTIKPVYLTKALDEYSLNGKF